MSSVETLKTLPARRADDADRTALLVRIYPPGPELGKSYPVLRGTYIIGRGEDCSIPAYHPSASRRHACIEQSDDGYYVADLHSTNGTFVNDEPVKLGKLQDGDYLRIGQCIYRFLASDNVEARYHEELYRLIIIDALTEIPNRRYLIEYLERELARATRHHRPVSLALLDLDRFSAINERLGHLGGDFILRELAACIGTAIRKEELFARSGGEEFVLVLPEADLTQAMQAVERIRHLVAHHPFQYESVRCQVTVSIGVVSTAGEETMMPEEFLRRADAHLYRAKHEGRNRVVG
jgi:diguanylate cyclase (GGDEF)-like protein